MPRTTTKTHTSDGPPNRTGGHRSHSLRSFSLLALLMALALVALPVLAQSQGKGVKKGHDNPKNPHSRTDVQHDDSDDLDMDQDDSDDSDAPHRHRRMHDDGRLRVVDGQNRGHWLDAGTEIIALTARVTNLDTGAVQNLDLSKANEPAHMQVGDRVRVELLGTAIVDGNGVAVEVPANFQVASGSWRIDTAAGDSNSIIVLATQPNSEHRGNPQGRSALAFDVLGNYEMKPKLANGRVTFEIADRNGNYGDGYTGGGGQPGTVNQPWKADERWEQTEEIASHLAHIDFNPDGLNQRELDLIYDQGLAGIRQAAALQASLAERSGVLRSRDGADVLAHAYRHLLGRQGDTRAIASADPEGFRSNLEMLERRGYQYLVTQFVSSDEFRRVHDIDRFESLPRTQDRRDAEAERVQIRRTRPN